jgi:arginyl-tRNA synthetase
MEKNEKEKRIIWVKTYQLTDLGRWFALLLAEEKELTEQEKSEILQSLFRTYVKLVKDLAEELNINKETLEEIFKQEMKAIPKK